jgi:hypothetical protein
LPTIEEAGELKVKAVESIEMGRATKRFEIC